MTNTPRQAVHVGIDVSERTLDVCIPNDQQGFDEVLSRLAKSGRRPELVVVEAIGRYERPAAAAISASKIPVTVVNPRQAMDFA